MANLSTSELKRNIAAILKGADLNTLSSKKVRKQLEEKFETDLTDRKVEIDKMLMDMITTEQNDNEENSEESEKQSSDESKENSDSEEDVKPHPKKSKPEAVKNFKEQSNKKKAVVAKNECYSGSSDNSEVDDEALARKLQEEERKSRSRAVKKNSGKKDSSKKGSKNDTNKPKVRKGESSYTRKCVLSAELAEVVGANEMARHDVVKKMWSVVRERNLFDPSNKQFAVCDEQLQSIFGTKRVRMFGMMKYLKNHIKDQK